MMGNQIPWRCLVPWCFCTGLDGVDGVSIRQIIEASSASVTLSQDGDTPAILADKVVLIGGTSEQQKLDACAYVVKHLRRMEGVGDRDNAVLVILVPKDSGAVIVGAKGAAIKRVMQESGAEINIGREEIPGMSDLPVSINGTPDKVLSAVSRLNAILQDMFERGNLKSEDFAFRGRNFDFAAEPPRPRPEAKPRPPVAKSVFGKFGGGFGSGSSLGSATKNSVGGGSNQSIPSSQVDMNPHSVDASMIVHPGLQQNRGNGAEQFGCGHGCGIGRSEPLPARSIGTSFY